MSELIFETIVTTLNEDGSSHAAPFGVREQDGKVLIAPFRPSASLDNMLRTRCAVVNLTDDVSMFAGCLTNRRDWPLSRAERIDGVVLKGVLAHRELELAEVREDATRPQLLFHTIHEAVHAPFRGFNRAQAAVIELAVLASRLHMLPIEKIDKEIEYLAIAVEKTAGAREWQAWSWLLEHIDNFKAAQRGDNLA